MIAHLWENVGLARPHQKDGYQGGALGLARHSLIRLQWVSGNLGTTHSLLNY